MLILPCKCNQSLTWKERKKCNKVVTPNQPLQETGAHLEHLNAPQLICHLPHKAVEISPGRNCSGGKRAAGSDTSGGREGENCQ